MLERLVVSGEVLGENRVCVSVPSSVVSEVVEELQLAVVGAFTPQKLANITKPCGLVGYQRASS